MVEEDLRAEDDGELGGSPARRCCAKPAVHVAPLVVQGNLTAAGSGEEMVPASDYRALQNQVYER